MVVRHLDGNTENNTLGNLSYGTAAENTADSIRHGTNFAVHVEARRTHCPQGHPYDATNTIHGMQGNGKTGAHRGCRECKRAGDRRRYYRDIEASRLKAREAQMRRSARLRAMEVR